MLLLSVSTADRSD
uniref:Uncharacterized protein n=1 Tax=Arundo donax TaxID=35708 RepID=A0A0A9HJM5_ARUDO